MFDDVFDADFLKLPLPDRYELTERQPNTDAVTFCNFDTNDQWRATSVKDKETGTLCTWNHKFAWEEKRVEIELTNGDKYLIPRRWWLCAKNKGPLAVSSIEMEKALKCKYTWYGHHTYYILECLGCDQIIKDGYEYDGPPKCVTVVDYDRPIALPRKMYRTSSVLQDDDLMQIDVMPIPFTKLALDKAVGLVFNPKRDTDMEAVKVLDFLGCTKLFPDPKNVMLTESDWDQVLTMTPCIEQLMSGFTLTNGVLTLDYLKIYHDDEDDIVCECSHPSFKQTLRCFPSLPKQLRGKVWYIYRGDLRFSKNDRHALYGVQGKYNPETKVLKYKLEGCFSVLIEGERKRPQAPMLYGEGSVKRYKLPSEDIPTSEQEDTRYLSINAPNNTRERLDYFGAVSVRNDLNHFPNACEVKCVEPYHDLSVYAGMTMNFNHVSWYHDEAMWYVFS